MKQCPNPNTSRNGAIGNHATPRAKVSPSTMTATTTTTTTTSGATTTTSSTMSSRSKHTSTSSREAKVEPKTPGSKSTSSDLHPMKQQQQQQYLHHAHHYPLHHHQLGAKMSGKLGASGVESLSALHMLPAHLREMFLAAHLLRGYYQPAGPLISPHLLGQPAPSQHGSGSLAGKTGPDGDPHHPGPPQPHASSTADSADSDVLLTGVGGVDLSHRSQPYGTSRYGPAGGGGPPTNLYPRPMQMHCPPTYLAPGYYAPSPYGPQPPPPHGPPPEMYYTHAYPAHFYPKFTPPYYPTTRRYYPGPGPGPEHHMYEQGPPPSSAQGPPGPPGPPPAGAQLVPAGPQGPQHLDHYPYPPYPGYGSPGPGSGGQCYPRNLQHPPPPPPYMDAHYTTNCPCPMQCPKNVNAGSLIGIKASKGPVATNNHIVQNQPSNRINVSEPITISSSSSSASSSSSPAPHDINAPIVPSSQSAVVDIDSSVPAVVTKQPQHPPHGYHSHHHHGAPPIEMHPHPVPYHHHHHPSRYPPVLTDTVPKTVPTSTAVSSSVTTASTTVTTEVVSSATTAIDHHHPGKLCYKTEQMIKPEAAAELLSTPMHYGDPYHHHYHHPLDFYHHEKLSEMKEEPRGTMTPPYSLASKMALLEPPNQLRSSTRGSTGLGVPSVLSAESLLSSEDTDKIRKSEGKLGSISLAGTVVKQEIEEFKLLEPLTSTICKKEDFEETGPAMTPDLLDESIVIKKDRDEEKPNDHDAAYHHHQHPTHPLSPHHLHHHHHLQQVHVAPQHPHHMNHHSARKNLLHGPPAHHHHRHPLYDVLPQHQRPPLITGLLVEKDDGEIDAKLPPDSKDLLTELVLTTEASMVEPPKTMSSSLTTATTVTVATTAITTLEDLSSKMDVSSGIRNSSGQQPRGNSSDSSINLSDSLTPGAVGAAEPLSRTSKDDAKVQSHDSGAGTMDPPSPVLIPASTVKRRPLLVACKKATSKHSPPNSYKNLIKRTNGLEDEDGLRVLCPEPVELSEEEEEEEDDEEEEGEDDEEDEETVVEDEGEDVEDIELAEQRMVESERRSLPVHPKTTQSTTKHATKRRKLTIEGRKERCTKRLLATPTTPNEKKHPRNLQYLTPKQYPTPKVAGKMRGRFVKRFRRVFRSSIQSFKRFPVSQRERLLRRSGITLVQSRPNARQQVCKTPPSAPEITHETEQLPEASEKHQPISASEGGEVAEATVVEDKRPNEPEAVTAALPNVEFQAETTLTEEDAVNRTYPEASTPVTTPISNVDRTIDLVAKGYFSEPEILTGTKDLQLHSRAWLKKLKQQQQQEGRSQSEQSRGAKRRDRSGEGRAKKCKTKTSPLALEPIVVSETPCVAGKGKPAKSKAKSKKSTRPVEVQLEIQTPEDTVGVSEQNSKQKKANSKERKKDSSSRKRKQKNVEDDGQDRVCKRSPASIDVGEALYQRATSTPLPSAGDHQDREGDDGGRKVDHVLDDSAGMLMDHSSVMDDRETDFDDAATMLVEDDVVSVDTSVLINRHNNNNNSTVTDKNNPGDEQLTQQLTEADHSVLEAPLQGIIVEGKEGSELEPPEGMEPFMDDQLEDEEQVPAGLQSLGQQPSHPTLSIVDRSPLMDYDDDLDPDEDHLTLKRGSNRTIKRQRSRSKTKSKKFSTKKRHRPSGHRGASMAITAELEELLVPKRCNTIPRWSNGWTWEGQPFQGKVFLNSDDPPVLRTCYPAMRHAEGDIIKPRDCVLLKAGNKRAELPYVAKVAYLWENPDDGEMMMSLLWYYRPEHTEQGRQRTDGPDEVFASRHKDHNSVACIEDKCYVLTFSEYCRFRRQLKGYEENIEEQPSIVPPLRRENPRLPPPIVSPELVMYCQRVYEFRLKRLLKSTS